MSKPIAIDMRMSWCESAKIIRAVLVDGKAQGKQEASVELMRMAQAADLAVEQEKALREMQAAIKTLELQRRLGVALIARFLEHVEKGETSIEAYAGLLRDGHELVKLATTVKS